MNRLRRNLWVGIIVLAVLSPLGVILPRLFRAEDAWGEWGTDALLKLLGYVPEGLRRTADLWRAPVSDYNPGGEGASLLFQVGWYVISAFIGVIIVGSVMRLLGRFIARKPK